MHYNWEKYFLSSNYNEENLQPQTFPSSIFSTPESLWRSPWTLSPTRMLPEETRPVNIRPR